MDERERDTGNVENRRKMERPMAALERIAEAVKRARGRLREDAEVDEIAVSGILDGAEPGKERRIRDAAQPEQSVPQDSI